MRCMEALRRAAVLARSGSLTVLLRDVIHYVAKPRPYEALELFACAFECGHISDRAVERQGQLHPPENCASCQRA